MKPSEFKKLVKDIRNCPSKRPLYIEASPGVGKTQIIAQAAKELGIGFKTIHAPLMQPEDYAMPVIYGENKDSLKFVVSRDKFPLETSDCPDNGILLIDELPQADNATQKILANLFQEREIHGQKLKAGWSIVATGNKVKDGSGANKVLKHLESRYTKLPLEVHLPDWTTWALDNDVKTEVIAFIRFRPELLSNFDPKLEISATPRAWVEGISAKIGLVAPALEFSVFSGDVGEGPASEFLAFLKIYRNLPNPDAILLNPKKAEVPKDAATQYAICGALVSRTTEVNFGRALEYIKRLPKEFSILYVKDSQTKCPEICNTKDYIEWASTDGAALLT